MIDVQEKRMPAEVEVPTSIRKIILQFHFIPINVNSQKAMKSKQKTKKSKTEDMAWDLNLVKDAVICLMLEFILHNAFAAAVIMFLLVQMDCYLHDKYKGK